MTTETPRPEVAQPAIVTIKVGTTLRDVERSILEATLAATRNNKVEAARLLGISRSAFYAKLKRFGILVPRGEAKEPTK